MTRRTEQVGDLLRGEISNVLLRKVRDPRIRLATVTSVEVSGDLRHAVVSISILGSESERNECLGALRHGSGFIRSELARSLRKMRTIPELRFEIDKGAEFSQRIDDLLERERDGH